MKLKNWGSKEDKSEMSVEKSKEDKSELSLGKSKQVCGYTVKRMPIGAYFQAIKRITNLPEDFVTLCFPGKSLQEVIDMFAAANETTLVGLFAAVMAVLPEYAIGVISDLTGISEGEFIEDDNIGIVGLFEIIKAFIEVNRLGEIKGIAKGIITTIKALIPIPGTGSNG